MKLTDSQIKIMQEDMLADLAQMLMAQWNCPMEEALDTLYNSDTFARLQDARTGLYYQSPGYVYSFLDNEMTTGKVS